MTRATPTPRRRTAGPGAIRHLFPVGRPGRGVTHEGGDPGLREGVPNVEVEIQHKSLNDLTATVGNAMNSPSAPDVAQGNQGWATDGALVKAGLLRPLDDVADAYGSRDAAGTATSQLQWSPDGTGFGSGTLYGMSPDNQMVGPFYNRGRLDSLGLKPPQTFGELEAALRAARSANQAAYGGSFGLPRHISAKSDATPAAIALVGMVNDPGNAERLVAVNRVPIATDGRRVGPAPGPPGPPGPAPATLRVHRPPPWPSTRCSRSARRRNRCGSGCSPGTGSPRPGRSVRPTTRRPSPTPGSAAPWATPWSPSCSTPFLFTWNEFLMPLVLVARNPQVQTAPLTLSFLAGSTRNFNPSVTAAAAALVALPAIAFHVVLQRRLIAGIASGAVKE